MTSHKAAKRLAELASLYGSGGPRDAPNGDPALLLATELISLFETAYMANDRSTKGQKAFEKAKALLRTMGGLK